MRKSDLYRPKAGDPPADRVILEKTSRNTLENAIYARDILAAYDVRSVLLITSRYHLKRAAILFRHALPRDVAIYPYPVDSVNVKEKWWQHEGSFRLLFPNFTNTACSGYSSSWLRANCVRSASSLLHQNLI